MTKSLHADITLANQTTISIGGVTGSFISNDGVARLQFVEEGVEHTLNFSPIGWLSIDAYEEEDL